VPEDSITSGVPAGTGDGEMRDGWSATYAKFYVNYANFTANPSDDPTNLLSTTGTSDILDLFAVGANGYVFKTFTGIPAVRYDKVNYDILKATTTQATPTVITQFSDGSTPTAMLSSGWAIYFDVTIANPTGMSCDYGQGPGGTGCVAETSVHLAMGIPHGTDFNDCSPATGAAGFAVSGGGTTQIKPTIHGDHWFFPNIPHGANESPDRYAQWLADADTNHDGNVTVAELTSAGLADFPTTASANNPAAYDFSGALITINNAYDYIVAESHSLGHFEGDGDCATRVVDDN